jgi:putative addiction module CopG family antidote
MDTVTLPQDLEQFAAEAVAAGRYRDMSEVLAAGVALLRQAEAEVAEFVRTLDDAQAEADREGCRAVDDVHREMAAMLDGMVHVQP